MFEKGVIQVAGVSDRAEAEVLIASGVHYLGFPLRLPVNAEDLSEAEAAALIADLPAGVHGVLITYLDKAEEIVAFCRELGVSIVQLHGAVDIEELVKIRMAAPTLVIIKSLVVRGDNLDELKVIIGTSAPFVDAYITDTFDPASGAEGATGMTHDWAIDRALVAMSPRPVILAGGLNPDNVAEAIRQVRPLGVDVHTGIEGADGRKDAGLTRRFVNEAKRGFAGID
ncbi:MAG: phosphoribosylanthranilate isomerase [Gammaproteobacteria bacterium]|nr:phosphoribosylanthranilate isomerase [Gammaproteobacteria bacterium]